MDGPAVVLQRDGADWKMIAPQTLDADTREVGDLVAAVCTLRAEEFLDNSSPLIAGARFDRPLAGVKLWKELPSTQSATQPATLPAPAATILFGQFADIGREKILVKVGDTIAKAAITNESWEKLGEAGVPAGYFFVEFLRQSVNANFVVVLPQIELGESLVGE